MGRGCNNIAGVKCLPVTALNGEINTMLNANASIAAMEVTASDSLINCKNTCLFDAPITLRMPIQHCDLLTVLWRDWYN